MSFEEDDESDSDSWNTEWDFKNVVSFEENFFELGNWFFITSLEMVWLVEDLKLSLSWIDVSLAIRPVDAEVATKGLFDLSSVDEMVGFNASNGDEFSCVVEKTEFLRISEDFESGQLCG